MDFLKELLVDVNQSVVLLCQFLAILVIGIGVIKAVIIFFRDALFGRESKLAIAESRMELGHAFSLGLGFLIGGSILNTTLAPTWNDIGQLAAIIAIRTILTHFLMKDIKRDKEHVEETRASTRVRGD